MHTHHYTYSSDIATCFISPALSGQGGACETACCGIALMCVHSSHKPTSTNSVERNPGEIVDIAVAHIAVAVTSHVSAFNKTTTEGDVCMLLIIQYPINVRNEPILVLHECPHLIHPEVQAKTTKFMLS